MPLEYLASQKGHPLLYYDGFVYKKDRVSKDTQHWRCVETSKLNCFARISTEGDAVKDIPGQLRDHNHAPDVCAANVRKVRTTVVNRALSTQETAHQIVLSSLEGVSPVTAARLPPRSELGRMVRRQRVAHDKAPASPATRSLLLIPDAYAFTELGEKFLQYDSGPAEERILVFGANQQLGLLRRCDAWYADGTYKVCPELFAQVSSLPYF
jgi:hypothetical protein